MCTSIAMTTKDFYFGRNMDLDYQFGEHVVITPRNYPFQFRRAGMLKKHYAMIGMATVEENYPLYAEAVNEKGLCMAGLNFPDNAYYPKQAQCGKENISQFELIPWILGKCSSVEEAKRLLNITCLIDIPFKSDMPVAPLHWHIADKNGSIVLEAMKNGIHVYDNPVQVMTNNPPFEFQMTNLGQYLNLTVDSPQNCFSKSASVLPFGKGLGSFGLPGDFSPASRFVKAAYLRLNSVCDNEEKESVSQFFRILDSVSVVNGSIATEDNGPYYTIYSCCVNVDKGIFYYKTYYNSQITAVNMNHENLDEQCLKEFEIVKAQQIAWAN
ncbi:MAG: choloylglycine hydrolase family protein [Lachnospiraceae bacterium]|nr:choloylglycine hydrolase family protein [Lachnospiraceae bacterium]